MDFSGSHANVNPESGNNHGQVNHGEDNFIKERRYECNI